MAKIKVVQVAYMGVNIIPQYVDDKGRVWIKEDVYKYIEKLKSKKRVGSLWRQIDLPDEPTT